MTNHPGPWTEGLPGKRPWPAEPPIVAIVSIGIDVVILLLPTSSSGSSDTNIYHIPVFAVLPSLVIFPLLYPNASQFRHFLENRSNFALSISYNGKVLL